MSTVWSVNDGTAEDRRLWVSGQITSLFEIFCLKPSTAGFQWVLSSKSLKNQTIDRRMYSVVRQWCTAKKPSKNLPWSGKMAILNKSWLPKTSQKQPRISQLLHQWRPTLYVPWGRSIMYSQKPVGYLLWWVSGKMSVLNKSWLPRNHRPGFHSSVIDVPHGMYPVYRVVSQWCTVGDLTWLVSGKI